MQVLHLASEQSMRSAPPSRRWLSRDAVIVLHSDFLIARWLPQVAKLTDEERQNFIGLLEALGAGDGRRAAGHVLEFSKTQTCHGDAAEGQLPC